MPISEMNIMVIRDLPFEEGLFDLMTSSREQVKVTEARSMDAGIRKSVGGIISVSDKTRVFSAPLICISPQQKPMAKLLYHNTAKGRNESRPDSIAAIITAAAV